MTTLAISNALLWVVLLRWTARDLRGSAFYSALFLMLGVWWLGIGSVLLHWLGSNSWRFYCSGDRLEAGSLPPSPANHWRQGKQALAPPSYQVLSFREIPYSD